MGILFLPALGSFGNLILGPSRVISQMAASAGAATFAMAALNTGWCARFTARDTRDVLTVYISWGTVTAAGTVQLRIETIDATSGKPTGTLYDANAVLNFTPSTAATWQTLTFATPPSTGLVAGSEYAVVLLTTVGGTAQTLRSSVTGTNANSKPYSVLTAADGTTRSNFTEPSGGSTPCLSIAYSGGLEEAYGFAPWPVRSTFDVYGTRAWGCLLTLTTTITVQGIDVPYVNRGGSPGDLRARIFDSTGTQVTGASSTADKDSLTNVDTQRMAFYFPGIVTLPPGAYRVVFDQTDHTSTSSNFYRFSYGSVRSAVLIPQAMIHTNTTDITAGPIVWTTVTTDEPVIGILLDDIPNTLVANRGIRTGGRM